ncbi:hypothetical protein TNCV_2144341 [Trichonephila clavipes]|nr:hypothetical protein TNCV_2144341 [Trichonephila clavipes]
MNDLTFLGDGMRSVPPSHIEMYLGLKVEKSGLRGSFLIGELEEKRGCEYGDCLGDIRCDRNFSEKCSNQSIQNGSVVLPPNSGVDSMTTNQDAQRITLQAFSKPTMTGFTVKVAPAVFLFAHKYRQLKKKNLVSQF